MKPLKVFVSCHAVLSFLLGALTDVCTIHTRTICMYSNLCTSECKVFVAYASGTFLLKMDTECMSMKTFCTHAPFCHVYMSPHVAPNSSLYVPHCMTFRIDEEDYGGHQVLLTEGIAPSISVFLVSSDTNPLWV